MKRVFLMVFTFLAVSVVMWSCSKDDDPADNDLFVGTYNGSVGFTSGETAIRESEGSVRVVKVQGDTYNFFFSNDIPNLSNINMTKGENNNLIFEDGAVGFIRITESSLSIGYANDEGAWSANASR